MTRELDARHRFLTATSRCPLDLSAVVRFADACIERLADTNPGVPVRDLPIDQTWTHAARTALTAAGIDLSSVVGRPAPTPGRWFDIRNETDRATVWIYDEIGVGPLSADRFARDLEAITAPVIDLRISSYGGSLIDAIAMVTAIGHARAAGHTVRGHVDGLAASAASYIAVACRPLTMSLDARLMIHDAWSDTGGQNAAGHRAEAELLDSLSNTIAVAYHRRSGHGTPDTWRALMREETWLTAEQAVELGLADRIVDPTTGLDDRALVTAQAGLHRFAAMASV